MKTASIVFCFILLSLAASPPALAQFGRTWSAASAQSTPAPQPKIAHFHLSGAVGEVPAADPFQEILTPINSLKTIVDRLDEAAGDADVKEVVITWDNLVLGLAQAEEIRAAILRVKAADKPVRVHLAGEALTVGLNTYAMLSAATSIGVEPRSDLWLTGLYGEQLFLKTMLDKIGVQGDFLHMGAYKSAAEIFTNTEPSPEADAMVNWIFDGYYDNLIAMIAEGRGLSADEVRALIDGGPYLAGAALEAGLVDKVEFHDEFVAALKQEHGDEVAIDDRYGEESGPRVDPGNPFAFLQLFGQLSRPPAKVSKDTIGIVYVNGVILAGHAEQTPFGRTDAAYGADIRHWLTQAADDPEVAAVVLRVDSPGGSALGSEQIWRGTQKVRENKPLIVSMGNVAGSGGYYCSVGAEKIFADRNTLTASIGVVGGKFVTTPMWDKLGVNWVPYRRGARADLFASSDPFSDEQRQWFGDWMNAVYERFQKLVADGRGDKLAKPMAELAGGRVFTGTQAKELGLIDEIGGLHDAVAEAARLAGSTNYEARAYPRPKDIITQILEDLSGEGERTSDLNVVLGARGAASLDPVAALPALNAGGDAIPAALSAIDPHRAAAARQALLKLQLLQKEGIALVMPYELTIR